MRAEVVRGEHDEQVLQTRDERHPLHLGHLGLPLTLSLDTLVRVRANPNPNPNLTRMSRCAAALAPRRAWSRRPRAPPRTACAGTRASTSSGTRAAGETSSLGGGVGAGVGRRGGGRVGAGVPGNQGQGYGVRVGVAAMPRREESGAESRSNTL